MKTKLLFLMIFISNFANAQVSFGNPYATNVTSTSATLMVL